MSYKTDSNKKVRVKIRKDLFQMDGGKLRLCDVDALHIETETGIDLVGCDNERDLRNEIFGYVKASKTNKELLHRILFAVRYIDISEFQDEWGYMLGDPKYSWLHEVYIPVEIDV